MDTQMIMEDPPPKVHPAANIFPMMGLDELDKLAADIKAHGQREPITYLDDQLLDGRNRKKACEIAGVDPLTCEIDAENIHGVKFDPLAYVLSVNLHRRHLTDSQRAMVSTECEKLFAADAKERQRAAGGDKSAVAATVPQAPTEREPTARDKAAAALGVSARTVTAAKRVQSDGAEVVGEAVRDGKLSVSVAERLVRKIPDKARQEKVIENAARCSSVRDNDRLVKQAIETSLRRSEARTKDREPVAAAALRRGKEPVGLAKGNQAIDLLKTIPLNDEFHLRGHQIVVDYVRHNFRTQPSAYTCEGEGAEVAAVENCKRWENLLAAAKKLSKLAEAMADDGILTVDRLQEANESSTAFLLDDMFATLPVVQLLLDVSCEAGGPV